MANNEGAAEELQASEVINALWIFRDSFLLLYASRFVIALFACVLIAICEYLRLVRRQTLP